MKPTLQIRQSQQLTLTPQLRQAIRLLQMSTPELNQAIDQALAQNPLLERMDDPWQNAISLQPDSSLRYHGADSGPGWQGEVNPTPNHEPPAHDSHASAELPTTEAGAAELYPAAELDGADDGLWGFENGGGARRDSFDDGDRGSDNALIQEESLHEHLLEQLAGTPCDQRQRNLVHMLIDELEDDGYLRSTLDELAAACPPELAIGLDELEAALRILQSFDPSGVGARSLNECLALQLQARAEDGESPPEPAVQALAQRMLDQDCLPMLASRELDKLCRLMQCRPPLLQEAIALIQSLDPRPGNRFSAEPPHYVTPDIIVRRTSQGWRAILNQEVVPRLRVNDVYEHLLKQGHHSAPGRSAGTGAGAEDETVAVAGAEDDASANLSAVVDEPLDTDDADQSGSAEGEGTPSDAAAQPPVEDSLGRQLQEARWMVKNVQQRFDTILRVSQAIVDRQKAFFSHGAVAMRPLVLREIAEAVGLHESTVSRVTTQKYMATPFGTVVELKYFFGSHVATDTGGAASSTAIRAHIKQLIKEEDTTHPLSDSHLTELLGQRGFVVARRTVAKYRESLGIPAAAQRKTR